MLLGRSLISLPSIPCWCSCCLFLSVDNENDCGFLFGGHPTQFLRLVSSRCSEFSVVEDQVLICDISIDQSGLSGYIPDIVNGFLSSPEESLWPMAEAQLLQNGGRLSTDEIWFETIRETLVQSAVLNLDFKDRKIEASAIQKTLSAVKSNEILRNSYRRHSENKPQFSLDSSMAENIDILGIQDGLSSAPDEKRYISSLDAFLSPAFVTVSFRDSGKRPFSGVVLFWRLRDCFRVWKWYFRIPNFKPRHFELAFFRVDI
ncbi:hypothetical protein CEXT_86141 [Caerostris extrusa]|uniref:Uncharacterized protein n=1 Tax=Caerostris extrusa TaxID=172846 RepID=A0AAV4WQP2_CAEEX|nr:hypothetical protein CEXT_86141 [Caerostris extrusa]